MWKSRTVLCCHSNYQAVSKQICRHASGAKKVLAIRREDNSVWERRAPLAPSHVKQLVDSGVKVIVQQSNRRAYPMQAYASVGAVIQEDISEAPLILGVKSIPIDLLQPYKTYAFFSHTIKAQEANMPLLDALLEKNVRLIDYEKMVEDNGRRIVAFGKMAGVAGMINILHGLGIRLLALGHHTPFMHIGPAHNYRNTGMACQALRDAGYEISLGMMPKSIGPLTFVFTGSGNVSQGAQEMLQNLPYELVSPEHLEKVAQHGATNKVYACVVDMQDHLVRKSDGGFDPNEYFEFPDRYASTFSVKYAPYTSVLINGIYWAPGAPRFITIPDAKTLLRPQSSPWVPTSPGCPNLPHRLLAICDISADPCGSIEIMQECTTIDQPFVVYDAEQNASYDSFRSDGVLVCSVDNMPAQLPLDATDFFGHLLLPHINDMLKSDATEPFDKFDTTATVKNAVITSNGELTPNFKYIAELRRKNRESRAVRTAAQEAEKKVLVLGAGFVSAPVVDYLTRDNKIAVTVAAQVKTEIDRLAKSFPNTTPILLDIGRNMEELEKLVKGHDLVISLLPYSLHPEVAKLCIKHKCDMVTASYRSPAMYELHDAAVDAGITIMNEVGVDPGIDHMLAMECFDDVKEHGGKISSFVSWCGGLPAPEYSANPLRYKFSWSPRGVLLTLLNSAKYLQDNKVVEVPGNGGLLESTRELDFLPGFHLEGYPNRDSTMYAEMYGIETAHTILRGTIRYHGFKQAATGLLMMGLIDLSPHPLLHPGGPDITWRELMCELLGQKKDIWLHSLKDLIYERVGKDDVRLQCIMDLGLLSETLIDKKGSLLDSLSVHLAQKLAYASGERDMIIMRHDVGIDWPNQSSETRHIDLIVYGNPDKYTAMTATVGFPTGIAAKMILEREIQLKGTVLPFTQDIYRPMLKRLEMEGITARESKTQFLSQSDVVGEETIAY
ncbi:hypothetical protein NP493_154g03016 [Ridgeia piscesae]|uniref:Saccharopine dehydrogenase (NAD(+), L-glutamate-forming) n=1 Tax=Ridgeia piscesae TaxID=27915 RepID=A0AAD9UFT4_RIDPI|nr:hypothetical protein NP493_154g03016 [Ridgeia piscesae]